MFFWTPGHANGWSPKMSPDGRYLIYGVAEVFGLDLFPGGTPIETTVSTNMGLGVNNFTMGFYSQTQAYFSNFDGGGTLFGLTPGSWTPATIFSGAGALGNVINASGNHWGTWTAAGSVYVVDGVAHPPSLPNTGGFGLAGQWIAYTIAGNFVVVENLAGTGVRTITPPANPGGIAAWRLFEGPDGGYLFYVQGGQIWINTPTNENIVANLPGTTASEGFGALAWIGTQLWVWTYANNPGDGLYYALGRPVGDANCLQLVNIGANNLSFCAGQWPTGWVIAGATDNVLGVWAEVPYDAARSSFLGSHGQGQVPSGGGGGGGGGSTNPAGSPGRAVLAQRAAPPPPLRDPRRYPHVDQIKDFPTQQTTRLVWDQLGSHQETLTTVQATVASQAAEIAELRETIARLTRLSNATYKGVADT